MAYEKKYPDGETARTCVRDGFTSNGDVACEGCFEKKLEIEKLREKVKSLQGQLRRRKNSTIAKPFGENTPPSKTLKPNSAAEDQKKKGGAKQGHRGYGRSGANPAQQDGVVDSPPIDTCPTCCVSLRKVDKRTRSIIDVHPVAAFKKLFSFGRFECPCCGDRFKGKIPALPKFQFSNRLLAQVSIWHYLNGVPLKNVARMLGEDVKVAALHHAFDRLAELCEPAKGQLIEDYRKAHVKHADETGWRIDGQSGYAWYFGCADTSIYEFRNTRSGSVAREVLGEHELPGFLVVDRYGAYNKISCKLQYCYSHLLRDVKSLVTEFPENQEIARFVSAFGKQLSRAMKLQSKKIPDSTYYKRAFVIRKKMREIVDAPASHSGIRRLQDIFNEKEYRLYHWVTDRSVPAHNNFAEREIRPTAIARKVSFGSQSLEGARRRANLMSVLHTARKRLGNRQQLQAWFENALTEIAEGADPIVLRVNPQ